MSEKQAEIPPELGEALRTLIRESIGDAIYEVRDREGLGWEGPRVKAYSDACKVIEQYAAPEGAMDWDEAKGHLDAVMQLYKDLLGTPGTMTGPALMLTFEPLARRYAEGERSRELYDAMMAVE